MRPSIRRIAPLLLAAFALLATAALAQGPGFANVPAEEPAITDWMTNPVTPIAHEVRSNAIFISALTLPYLFLPQILLLYCIFKFGKKPGRKPATFHEHLPLEIFWTVVPTLTLVALAIPSYWIIKNIENPPDADVQVTIIGHQFFWEYRYPELGDIRISEEPLILPVDKVVVADVTSVDVTHAWWVPAFGVKYDAIPGRNTRIWMKVEREGWYKGQCAELCGSLHSKMLIDVKVVSPAEFDAWIAAKQREASGPDEDQPDAGTAPADTQH